MARPKAAPRRGHGNACPVAREQILAKYWELANLNPEITKGTITGQLKALDSLWQELASEDAGEDDGAGLPSQQVYRSAWLRGTPRDHARRDEPAREEESPNPVRRKPVRRSSKATEDE
jgi:hypothetical protein